jgi:CRISPR/Cas system CSM-associated protein Csm4 (group 5 of RAMP superfamily)
LSVPDEDYSIFLSLSVPDEDYSNLLSERTWWRLF